MPKDREELQGKLGRFMQRLAKLPARIASYFEPKYIEYAAVPECERRAENVARGGRKTWRPVPSGYYSPAPASMVGSAGLAASPRRRRRASLSR